MVIGVLKEQGTETRVSLVPEHLATLLKLNTRFSLKRAAG